MQKAELMVLLDRKLADPASIELHGGQAAKERAQLINGARQALLEIRESDLEKILASDLKIVIQSPERVRLPSPIKSLASKDSFDYSASPDNQVKAYIVSDNKIAATVECSFMPNSYKIGFASTICPTTVNPAIHRTMLTAAPAMVGGTLMKPLSASLDDYHAQQSMQNALEFGQGTKDIVQGLHSLEDASAFAKELRMATAGAKASKIGVVTSIASTSASVLLTNTSNQALVDIARQLHEAGKLSTDAYKDYKKFMGALGPMLTAQAADPFPTALPGMLVMESIAQSQFKSFSDKYGLSQQLHEILNPGVSVTRSLRMKFADDTIKYLPAAANDTPEFTKLIAARIEYTKAVSAMRQQDILNTPGGDYMGPEIEIDKEKMRALKEAQDAASDKYHVEFERLLSNPATAEKLLNLIPPNRRLEIFSACCPTSLDQLKPGQHDLVAQHAMRKGEVVAFNTTDHPGLTATEKLELSRHASEKLTETKRALLDNPEVMTGYLVNFFTGQLSQPEGPSVKSSLKTQELAQLSFAPSQDL